MPKDLQGNCMYRRIQAYPSISTFKIIQSVASIKGLSVAKVASDILSNYCNQMNLSEREQLIKRYDSTQAEG